MNSRCPTCSHEFPFREWKRFSTWHLSRRSAVCPECRSTLVWGRSAYQRLMAGLLLVTIFDGVLLGTCFAPQIGLLFGFAEPQSLHDPYWGAASARATKSVAL